MHFYKNLLIYLLNFLLFLSVLFAIYCESKLAYLFCLLGSFLNIFHLFKAWTICDKIDSGNRSATGELNLSEKNMIMEDLDREVTRRREEEKLKKN